MNDFVIDLEAAEDLKLTLPNWYTIGSTDWPVLHVWEHDGISVGDHVWYNEHAYQSGQYVDRVEFFFIKNDEVKVKYQNKTHDPADIVTNKDWAGRGIPY